MRVALLGFLFAVAPCGGKAHVYPAPKVGDAKAGEHAFYASDLGSGGYGSFPVLVFRALLTAFPDRLPSDLALVGLYPKPAADDDGLPAGFVRVRQLGVEFAATNCGVCHLGRLPGTDTLYAGVSNTDFDIQKTSADMMQMLMDERFTADTVIAAAHARGEVPSVYEQGVVRFWLWQAKKKLAAKPPEVATGAGPGRSDAVNRWKRILHQPQGDALSYVDTPVIYQQQLKTRTLYDGSIVGDPAARVMLTEIQKGRPPSDLLSHREVFDDLVAYLKEGIRPPVYPYPIDHALAEEGEDVFNATCARCHGHYGARRDYPNKRIAIDSIGTDANRARAMDAGLERAIAQSSFADSLHMERALVYVAPPLDGIWASAPYLHNGSVPTLADLFEPEEQRPATFYRRMNAFDPVRVGFACPKRTTDRGIICDPDARQLQADPELKWLYLYDTSKPGNGNAGHGVSTKLSARDKLAVLEYLKTL